MFRLLPIWLLLVSLVPFAAGAQKQDISSDPFIQEAIKQENWAPGGKFFSSDFENRGSVIEQTGEVKLTPQHTQTLGNFKLQNADIAGDLHYVVNLSAAHGHEVHSPFDNSVSDEGSDRSPPNENGVQSSYSMEWTGTFVHPANGYDPPTGGGFPTPDSRGAIDIIDYSIKGFATGIYPLATSEIQARDLAPVSGFVDRASNAFSSGFSAFQSGLNQAGTGAANVGLTFASYEYDAKSNTINITGERSTGNRVRQFGNGVLDTALGLANSTIGAISSTAAGFIQPEIMNLSSDIAEAAVDGFSGLGVEHQYAALGTKKSLSSTLEAIPEIGKSIEAISYVGGGAVLKKIALKGRKAGPIASSGSVAYRTGKAGEDAVAAVYNIGSKRKISVNGRNRIPDGLTGDSLNEVKNVATQSYTQQLRDFATYAKQQGIEFNLFVRSDTSLTGPLLKAAQAGDINILKIPGS